jgi:hypothetical protein
METTFFVIGFFAVVIALITGVLVLIHIFASKDDLKSAGVHTDQSAPINLVDIYKEPFGFEPHGSRGTFVPPPMKPGDMSTDQFIHHLVEVIESEVPPTLDDMKRDIGRALSMLVNARDIIDDIEPCGHIDEDFENRINNWLIRGHQD